MTNEKGLKQFRQTITQMADIPEAEWNHVSRQLSEREFKKNQYLIQAGEISKNFYFITRGMVRFFYSTQDGKEFNKHFAMENQFAGSMHSLSLNAPCGFYIQALEKTTTLVLPHKVMQTSYQRHPCWDRLGRKNAEYMFLFKEAREKELLLDSLETRYHRFLKNFPGISERIPQYHIASYLGVTDVALSRIRKNL